VMVTVASHRRDIYRWRYQLPAALLPIPFGA
jgi:hypothetical protein